MQGSCWCGGVRFEVSERFIRASFCHCTSCKRISGGVGTANGRARTEWITVTDGRDLLTTYQPDEGLSKTFCSRCGSNVFGAGWPESEHTSVRLPTLDDAYRGRIESHIYVRSLAPWETLPDDGAERFDARST